MRLVLLSAKPLVISLSLNTTLNSLFKPAQDRDEKWEIATFKTQRISEWSVLLDPMKDCRVFFSSTSLAREVSLVREIPFHFKKLALLPFSTFCKCFFPVLRLTTAPIPMLLKLKLIEQCFHLAVVTEDLSFY